MPWAPKSKMRGAKYSRSGLFLPLELRNVANLLMLTLNCGMDRSYHMAYRLNMVKKLVLLRHAHRDTTERSLDNGLSLKGKAQAKAIKAFFESRFARQLEAQSLWLVASPKLRCVETLQPVAKAMARDVDRHPLLIEQSARETGDALRARVQKFLREWRDNPTQLTLACSHGDWLPIAVAQLAGLNLEVKKGSWIEFELIDSEPVLRWFIPSFKHFG